MVIVFIPQNAVADLSRDKFSKNLLGPFFKQKDVFFPEKKTASDRPVPVQSVVMDPVTLQGLESPCAAMVAQAFEAWTRKPGKYRRAW